MHLFLSEVDWQVYHNALQLLAVSQSIDNDFSRLRLRV